VVFLASGDRDFKNFIVGNAFALLGTNLLMGTLSSLVPAGSLNIFLLFMAITLVEIMIAWVWWKNGMELVRFNSLTAFLLCITVGLFMVVPLLRITWSMPLFWIVLAAYILMIFYALIKKEVIFQAFYKPGNSRIAKGTVIVLIFFLVLGAFSFRYGQEMVILASMNDQQGALYVSSFTYGLGLLLTFVSTALLKKPSEIKS
jgi:hypothetical protein